MEICINLSFILTIIVICFKIIRFFFISVELRIHESANYPNKKGNQDINSSITNRMISKLSHPARRSKMII